MVSGNDSDGLKRGLKNRHIQLIALGGALGTGLFLGIAQTIKMAGPSVLLGYAVAGVVAFFIMRQLGEMVVDEPVAGSFSYFANKYFGHFTGFLSGWNYWVLYILVSMAELSAVGIYVQYWWPGVPTWVSALVFFVAINLINLTSVKSYGETEFWFSIIKVAAIVGMIGFGGWLLASGHAGPEATVRNLWQHGGFFPNGVSGLVMSMAAIMFSFGGLELVGITAAEADDPKRSIPRATNQVIYRILIFYIGALAVLLSLYPWEKVVNGGSRLLLRQDRRIRRRMPCHRIPGARSRAPPLTSRSDSCPPPPPSPPTCPSYPGQRLPCARSRAPTPPSIRPHAVRPARCARCACRRI
jgi:aromatic amino acid transport protein AroP